MADDLATIGYKADLTGINQINRGLDSVGRHSEKAERKINKSSSSITSKLGAISTAVTGVVAAFGSMSKLVDVTRQFDVINAQLVTATGNAQNAADAFGMIQQFAATTPYDLQQVTKAFTQLSILGLNPSERALNSYGNTASAMGKSLSQFIEAVADATVGEFERLKEFGIKARSQGDKVSLTFQGVTKTIGKNAAEIESYLIALGENQFAGSMARRAATLDGAISNLGDTWDNLFLEVSRKGVGDIITTSVRTATKALGELTAFIASGELGAKFDAIFSKFSSYGRDVAFTLDKIGDMFGESAGKWADFGGFVADYWGERFARLPEDFRALIKLIAVELASIVDYGIEYGSAFGEVIGIQLANLVEKSKVYGRAIADAINPFSDENGGDIDTEIARLDKLAQDMSDSAFSMATQRADAISNARKETIIQIMDERDAALKSFNEQFEAADTLTEKYNEALKQRKAYSAESLKPQQSAASSAQKSDLDAFEKWVLATIEAVEPARALRAEMAKVNEAMIKGGLSSAIGTKRLQQLQDEMDALSKTIGNPFDDMTNGAMQAMQAMSGMFESGTREAQALSVATQGVQFAQAYTTGNVGGMVAGGVGIIASIDAMTGAIEDNSKELQARQGLNEWNEKASSIDDSVSMVASATDKLVGINTNMLSALQNLQSSLLSAAGVVVKGVETPEVSANLKTFNMFTTGAVDLFGSNIVTEVFDFLTFNWLFKGVGSLFGGSSKVTNEGIRIVIKIY